MHYSLFHFSISRSLVVDSRIFQILFWIKSSKASRGILPFGRVAAQLLCFGSTAQQKWFVRSFIFSFRHKSFHKHFSDHTDYMALRTSERLSLFRILQTTTYNFQDFGHVDSVAIVFLRCARPDLVRDSIVQQYINTTG